MQRTLKRFRWTMNDWMKTVRSPIRYRVNNTVNLKFNSKIILMSITFSCFVFLIYALTKSPFHNITQSNNHYHNLKISYKVFDDGKSKLYNSTYPLTPYGINKQENTKTYEIMAVADLDTKSKLAENSNTKYVSYLLKGTLTLSTDHDTSKQAFIEFNPTPIELSTQYAYGDRGMELSELIVFNGKLYSCDDRTGIIYEIDAKKHLAIPWVVLVDGDGQSTTKGFKCEWMTVKDEKLFVGGMGKEWTTAKGVLVNHNPQWVKVVGHLGDVSHIDWRDNYESIRKVGGFTYPGYMIFESCVWNEKEKKWYFLPRRASQERYDEELDEKRATNLLVIADEDFQNVKYKQIGEVVPVRGYSSFKFVPHTNKRLIIALKSEEDEGNTKTYITLFDRLDGNIIIKDQIISSSLKYEGIEFI